MDNEFNREYEIRKQLRRDKIAALAINVICIGIFGSSKSQIAAVCLVSLLLASVTAVFYRQAKRKGDKPLMKDILFAAAVYALVLIIWGNNKGLVIPILILALLGVLIIAVIVRHNARKINLSAASFAAYYKAASTAKKIGMLFIAFLVVCYAWMKIEHLQSEEGKIQYQQLSSETFKQIYSEEEPLRLMAKEIANTEYPLNPSTITGDNKSSDDYLKKHDDCQADKYRELRSKVLEKYNISESTYDRVVMHGASQAWDRNGNPPQ